ncbi:MAG: hypothetical protein AAF266_02730 [Planctomycetota bacterium]
MPHGKSLVAQLTTTVAFGLVVVASMGASCSPRFGSPFGVTGPPAPVVLTPAATAADVVAAINANTDRIQTYQASQATVSLPESAGLPLVTAPIAVERPRRFRLRGTTAFTGPEIDLGSNDERFWLWARRNEPPALYTARHDQWATSPMRSQLPIEPGWLIEGLGMVQLDPSAAYTGPTPRGDGSLELRAQVAGPNGTQQRVYVIDAQTAAVREQHVYDPAGTLMASVFADRFRYDVVSQTSLPERVRLNVPAAGLDLTINTGAIVVNAPVGNGGQLWSPPQLGAEYPTVDLTAHGGGLATNAGPWDLAGVDATYGRPPSIATPYAEPLAATQSAVAPTPPLALEALSNQPDRAQIQTATARPIATPQAAGFVGLPAGGRTLE